jgi:hypothetical protein
MQYSSEALISILSPFASNRKKEQQKLQPQPQETPSFLSQEAPPPGLLTPRISTTANSTNDSTLSFAEMMMQQGQETPRRRKKKSELDSLLEASPMKSSNWFEPSSRQTLSHRSFPDQETPETRITRRATRLIESGRIESPIPTASPYRMTLRNGSSTATNSFAETYPQNNSISSLGSSEEKSFVFQLIENIQVACEMFSKAQKMASMLLFGAFCTFSSGFRAIRGEKRNFALFFGRFLVVFVALLLLKWAFFNGNSSKALQHEQQQQQEALLQKILSKQTELEGEFYKRINESFSVVQQLSDSMHQLKEQSEQAIKTTKKDTATSMEQLKGELTSLIEGKVANLFLLINSLKANASSEPENGLSFETVEQLVQRVEQMESNVSQILPALAVLQERFSSNAKSPFVELEDFALVSKGASIVESLTSKTFEVSSFLFGRTKGKQPETALSPNNALGNFL